jgi:hypothetical protein
MDTYTKLPTDAHKRLQLLCDSLHLPLLPQWLPLLSAVFAGYWTLYFWIGPSVSSLVFPKAYARLNGRKRLDWDVHVVSFVNSLVTTILSARVVLFDIGRKHMDWQERAWGYTGPCAFALTIANGYFYWHLVMMIYHKKVYGWSMIAHASAVSLIMTSGYVGKKESVPSEHRTDNRCRGPLSCRMRLQLIFTSCRTSFSIYIVPSP